MFFRFGVALALVVLISLAGTALEKRSLQLKRAVSRQHYRLDILEERLAAERVVAQRLGAPSRLIDELDPEPAPTAQPAKPAPSNRKPGRQKRNTLPSSKRASH